MDILEFGSILTVKKYIVQCIRKTICFSFPHQIQHHTFSTKVGQAGMHNPFLCTRHENGLQQASLPYFSRESVVLYWVRKGKTYDFPYTVYYIFFTVKIDTNSKISTSNTKLRKVKKWTEPGGPGHMLLVWTCHIYIYIYERGPNRGDLSQTIGAHATGLGQRCVATQNWDNAAWRHHDKSEHQFQL